MTLLVNTVFAGLASDKIRPNRAVLAADLADVAKDQSLCYELLTGKNADGSSGASTTAAHSHGGGMGAGGGLGSALYWPLTFHQFGPTSPALVEANATYQGGCSIFQSGGSHVDKFTLMHWPVFVSAGWNDRALLLVVGVRTGVSLRMWATLEHPNGGASSPYASASLDPVAGSTSIPLQKLHVTTAAHMMAGAVEPVREALYGCVLTPDVVGLHAIKIQTDIEADDAREIHFVSLLPVLPGSIAQQPNKATTTTTLNTVGDPDATTANDWIPPDSSLYAADFPLGPAAMINQINSNYLEERCLGLPVSGNTARTLTGHAHTGKISAKHYDSKQIEFTLHAFPLGTYSTNAAIGLRLRCPSLPTNDNSYKTVARFYERAPVCEGAASNLKCAVMIRSRSDKSTGTSTVSVAANGGTALTFVSGSHISNDDDYLVTNANDLNGAAGAVLSGEYAEIIVQMKGTKNGTDYTAPGLLGMCFYFDT